jgi:hypothetical protein
MPLPACQLKQLREPITVRIDVHLLAVVRCCGELIASSSDDVLRQALVMTLGEDAGAGFKNVRRERNSLVQDLEPRRGSTWLGGVCIVPRLCTRDRRFRARTSRLRNASSRQRFAQLCTTPSRRKLGLEGCGQKVRNAMADSIRRYVHVDFTASSRRSWRFLTNGR